MSVRIGTQEQGDSPPCSKTLEDVAGIPLSKLSLPARYTNT